MDCQYACPAHTPVPEYIRLIAAERYTEAYMINWESNVFPGVLGRTCDRPCEPACRRGRVEDEPVAICRLKRVAADFKGDVKSLMPQGPFAPNGKRVALIGGGPASLTVARDLAPLGYEIHLFDEQPAGGGMMRSQIPSFRLPESVLDEEVGFILDMGIHSRFNTRVNSMAEILGKGYDAIFVGTGAPKDVTQPGDPIFASSSNSPGSEGVANSIDGQPTKYLNFDSRTPAPIKPSGFAVSPRVGPTTVTGMTIQSANDAPERDPKMVVLEGSNDDTISSYSSGTWEKITEINAPAFTARFQTQEFYFANSKSYKHYRWTVVATATDNGWV